MIINGYEKKDSSIIKNIGRCIKSKVPGFYNKFIAPAYLHSQDVRMSPIIKNNIDKILSMENFPIFTMVEIETLNRCNNSCSFCPVNKTLDTREYKKMDEDLFISIINQLKELNYTGMVGLYSNNEPLLDERIFDFCKIAKESLPNAYHYMYTNGILLTVEKMEKLVKYLDKLIIDNYNDKLKLIKPVQEIYDYCQKNDKYKDKIEIHLRKQNEVLTNRGGQAKNKAKTKALKSSCILPYCQFVIRPDGKISLCCNDAMGKYSIGDLTKETISDIWWGNSHKEIRKKIFSGRGNLALCRDCDNLCYESPYSAYENLSIEYMN